MLEVVIAIAVLTITTAILMRFFVAGDRLYSKSVVVKNATHLAQNEAEILKVEAPLSEEIEEREYEKEVGKRSYIIRRSVVAQDSLDSLINEFTLREVRIQVSDQLKPEEPLVTFRMLQGYHIIQ